MKFFWWNKLFHWNTDYHYLFFLEFRKNIHVIKSVLSLKVIKWYVIISLLLWKIYVLFYRPCLLQLAVFIIRLICTYIEHIPNRFYVRFLGLWIVRTHSMIIAIRQLDWKFSCSLLIINILLLILFPSWFMHLIKINLR